MKSVLVRLQEYGTKASGAEKGVVRFLAEKPEEAVTCSIHQLAERTFTSSSTIIRLCRKMGFEGYKELHKSLLYELAVRKESSRQREKEIKREDSLEDIVNKVTYKNIVSLEDTKKLLDLEVLKRCVELLDRSGNVCLFGMGSSLLVAKDAHLKLLRVNKNCSLSDDWHAQLLQARNMTCQDLAIIISYSGLTVEMMTCAEAVKANGAPIITITRFEDTPLSRIADYNLSVAATELIFRSGAMSSRISQLNLIDILYTAYINTRYEESMTQFNKTHIDKQHHSKEN